MGTAEGPQVSHGEWGCEGYSAPAGRQPMRRPSQWKARVLLGTFRRLHGEPSAVKGPSQEGTNPTTVFFN